jgi:hypothetical protein
MDRFKAVIGALALVLALPIAAAAQAALSGLVRDTSGAVLPGVTVEASSPVLIEKVRSAVSDGNGRYVIADLRPGDYRVSFTLPGFKTTVREGVELAGTATVTINVDLSVGGVEETITVSGESPTVNLQTTTRQAVMDQEIVSAIPSSRTPFTTGVLIPGVRRGAFMSQDVGGSVVQEVASLEANGGRTADQRMMVNGVALSSMIAGGWGGGAVPNATGTSEFAIDVSGVDAQAATGGVRINFIPRDGGNRFSGTVFGSFATQSFAADNFTGSDAQALGLTAPGTIKQNGDFNPGFGGPLKRDKMWFFLSGRSLYADNFVAGMFFNENVNRADRFNYVRSNRQAVLHQEQTIFQARYTWQVNPKNKIGVTADFEQYCACTTGISATVSPEAGNDRRFPVQRFVTLDWNNPVSSKVLLEASGIHRVERWGGMHPQVGKLGNIASLTPGIISITDTLNPVTGGPLTYRAAQTYNNSWNWNIHYRAALSYITGSHNFKVGYNNAYGYHDNTTYVSSPFQYTFLGGNPTGINYTLAPRTIKVVVGHDAGLFVQDKWSVGRWTLSGGLRFDAFGNRFPQQGISGTFFGRDLNVQFPETDNLRFRDITPKMAATWDVFGNGKTAFKVTANKYLGGLGTTGALADAPNPINRLNLGAGVNRTWADANGNFTPDCDLNNITANGECGAVANGGTLGTSTVAASYADQQGWGKREYNWEFTTSIQQEILPRVSAELQYARRIYGNFRVQDDLSVSAADYQRFTFTVPRDSRLPDGGGYTLTAFDLTPTAALRPVNRLTALASNYGKQTEHFDGVNFTLNARMQSGVFVQGGFGTGRVVTDDCDIVDDVPEALHTFFGNNTRLFFFAARPLERCHQNQGWRTQVQGLASYTIPKADVLVSGTFQNLPGAGLATALNEFSGGTLGRGYALAPFRQFTITRAGELFVERLNQVDLRLSKVLRFGTTKTQVNFDFYNVMNGSDTIAENNTYTAALPGPGAPAWRTPTTILVPRIFKFSAQFDF